MGKKEAMWRDQLQRAVNKVRDKANGLHDFDRGVQSGASMVACEFYKIQRRDAALKEDGIDPGSP